jgi:hypothetical protein
MSTKLPSPRKSSADKRERLTPEFLAKEQHKVKTLNVMPNQTLMLYNKVSSMYYVP